jgi:DNA-binding transcriptional LysR family regulator
MGIGIVPEVLVRDELARGTLRRASPRGLRTGEDYTLITPARELRPEVELLRSFLLDGRAMPPE